MIADTQVVDARVGDLTERHAQPVRVAVGRFERVSEESDADRIGREVSLIGRSDLCTPGDERPDDRRHCAP